MKVNLAMGGTGFAVFKTGSTLVGVGGGLDWSKLSVGFSGVSFPEIGYFYEGEVTSLTVPTMHAKGVVAFDMKPWALGFSGNYVSANHKGESEKYNVSSAELGLSNIEFIGGVLRRSGGNRFHAAGGAQILKNRLELVEPWDPVKSGEATATRFLIRAGYRTRLWAKGAFGADLDAKVTPGVVITDDDLSYDIAEGSELDVKIKPGFALYPDEQTTFAFDYNVNFVRVNLDTLAGDGRVTGEYALSETWTNTQVGLERWFTEEVSIKAGWRQNIFAFPRNTMFAGMCYRPNDRWMFNYDFHEGVIAVDKVSVFVTLADLVDPGGHRITLAYYF